MLSTQEVVLVIQNGVLSPQEVVHVIQNGVLSPQEVVHVIQELMTVDEQTAVAMMRMFDTNRDGSLDKTEFMQLWANMFGQ